MNLLCQRCTHPLHHHEGPTEEEPGRCRVTACRCERFVAPGFDVPPASRELKVEIPEGYAGKVSVEFWPELKKEAQDGEAG